MRLELQLARVGLSIATLGLLACAARSDKKAAPAVKADAPVTEPDVMAIVESSPRLVHQMVQGIIGGQFAIDVADDRAVVHGACPFECCGYGDWSLRDSAIVRTRPWSGAPVVARLPVNLKLVADSGIVMLDSIGLAIVQRDTIEGWVINYDVKPDSSKLHVLSRGDTIRILDYGGEGYWRVRWHGNSNDGMEQIWGNDSVPPVRLVREPRMLWWAHVTADRGAISGWIDMRVTGAGGADKCGGAASESR